MKQPATKQTKTQIAATTILTLALVLTGCAQSSTGSTPSVVTITEKARPEEDSSDGRAQDQSNELKRRRLRAQLQQGPYDWNKRHYDFDETWFTDKSFSPGKYSKNSGGKPAYMPINPHGDRYGGKLNTTEKLDCNFPKKIVAQQQYVHGRFILVSHNDGPTIFGENGPSGYAKTAVGAAIAASNASTYGLGVSDIPGKNFTLANTDMPLLLEKAKTAKTRELPSASPLDPPTLFRIDKCGDNSVTVTTARTLVKDDLTVYTPTRTTLKWIDNTWKVSMSREEWDDRHGNSFEFEFPNATTVVLK